MRLIEYMPPAVSDRLREGRRLARKRLWYERTKRLHLRLYEPDFGRAPDQDLLHSFVENGAVIVRDFLPRDVIQQIVAEVRPTAEAIAENRYRGPLRTLSREEAGLHRIYEVETSLSTSSRAFFDSPFLADLANSICGNGMHSHDRYLDYKAKVGGPDRNIAYHIDHWKLRLKAFLMLQDVTEEQAPFVYVTGSHKEERWRRRWNWQYQHKETADLSPDKVAKICRRYGYQERVFTGKAGDLIIADTRGIHRGNLLRSGTRLQLVNLYVMSGREDYAH